MTEEWRPVVGFEGFYEVSSLGCVRSIARWHVDTRGYRRLWPSHELKPYPVPHERGQDYFKVNLNMRGKKYNGYPHVIVCEAFHGPRPSLDHQVRHLNGVASDNRAHNLAWGTRSENAQDTLRHGHHAFVNKTHCKRGHEYTPENTRLMKNNRPGRICRECVNSRRRKPRAPRDPNLCPQGHVLATVGFHIRKSNGRVTCHECQRRWTNSWRARKRLERIGRKERRPA